MSILRSIYRKISGKSKLAKKFYDLNMEFEEIKYTNGMTLEREELSLQICRLRIENPKLRFVEHRPYNESRMWIK